jgi:hypothetical protein
MPTEPKVEWGPCCFCGADIWTTEVDPCRLTLFRSLNNVLGMSTHGLADLLFGRTRSAVLALLYGRTNQSFYTRQIAREVNASLGAVQRELENLSKVGLIVRNSVGSQVFYQANRELPYFQRCEPW